MDFIEINHLLKTVKESYYYKNGREKIMIDVSFSHTHTYGEIVQENELYIQKHFPTALLVYEANFVQFKRMPSLEEFKEVEKNLWNFHQKFGQRHLKFKFPENIMIPKELYLYLFFSGYIIAYNELYKIDPKHFPSVKELPNIRISPVTDENFTEYIHLQYELDKEFGIDYAREKRKIYELQLKDPFTQQIVAYYNDDLAGSVTVFVGKDIAEIDELNVLESFQRKGIGSKLQKYIMDNYSNKTIILVADGYDTPREMYQKQNYKYVSDRFEALKIIDEDNKEKVKRSV